MKLKDGFTFTVEASDKRPTFLRSCREELGMTQREIADALGVDPNTWARWERGDKEPGQPRILELALREIGRRRKAASVAPESTRRAVTASATP